MIFFHQIGRRSGAKPTISLIAPIVHKVRLDLQFKSVAKNLLNHARRKISTLNPLEMVADLLMKVTITTSGGDYNDSPRRHNGVKDNIDWSITGEEVEMLKAKVMPIYWESLLEISQRHNTGDETSLHSARLGSFRLFDGNTTIDQMLIS